MEPLTVATSVVGLLNSGAKVLGLLTGFIQNVNGAPDAAKSVLSEVAEVSCCLWKLQSFLLGIEVASTSRTALLVVEQIVVTLTSTVIVFSDLEEKLNKWKTDEVWKTYSKISWVLKENFMTKVLARLQSSKSSLHFMLTILNCVSMEEARASSNELYSMVQRVLESNEDIARRLRVLEMSYKGPNSIINTGNEEEAIELDDQATIISGVDGGSSTAEPSQIRYNGGFAFDKDLQASRVYTRATFRQSAFSLSSSAMPSISWSLMSGISLSAISNISVLSLPVSVGELWNEEHYNSDGHFKADTDTIMREGGRGYGMNTQPDSNDTLSKAEALRLEEEKLLEVERKIQREIHEKRKILLEKEKQLRELEARLGLQS